MGFAVIPTASFADDMEEENVGSPTDSIGDNDVAAIGENRCSTLAETLDDAETGDTIKLLKDIYSAIYLAGNGMILDNRSSVIIENNAVHGRDSDSDLAGNNIVKFIDNNSKVTINGKTITKPRLDR